MTRITGKENAADSQVIDHTDRSPVHRPPRDPRDTAPCNSLDYRLDALHGLSARHHLKKRSVRQGTKTDGTAFCEGPHVPMCAVQFFDLVLGVKLSADEKADLVAFMRQL